MEGIGDETKVVLKARFTSAEDMRNHVEEFHAIESVRQRLERLGTRAR